MEQLIMRWVNDGTPAQPFEIPENCRVDRFTELENAVEQWLDIVQYGLSKGKQDAEYFHSRMTSRPLFKEDKCFFIVENNKAVATLTVICDYEIKLGYIHMVACHEKARGKGYGTLLNQVALATLKNEGMKIAYLTTDDFRIPAIKSYLRAGFMPDCSTESFAMRWNKIFEQINGGDNGIVQDPV